METLDLLIIGAGWSGLTMAKTYHEAYPEASLKILDSAGSVGGSWAGERIYPGLNTNNILGSYEFSDFPMKPDLSGAQPGSHIPGEMVHRYLCEAVRQFKIEHFLQLRTKVEKVRSRDDGVWEVSLSGAKAILAKKLVVATGLTSEPFVPDLDGSREFKGLLIHSKKLKTCAKQLAEARTVVVIGGNKSAWDACYSVARSGNTAHMIIRPSGGGPSWTWPRSFQIFGWTTSLPKLSFTRFWTLFDPWPFHRHPWIGDFLHCSVFGRWTTAIFWATLGHLVRKVNRYDECSETEKLVPWNSTYWMDNSLSTLNYPSDWFELVRGGNIVVHRADVVSLSKESVELSNKFIGGVDAVVCCTGWKAGPSFDFEPAEVRDEIGIPSSKSRPDATLMNSARQWIQKARPDLKDIERDNPIQDETQPYRLYRFMVPPSKRFLHSRNLSFIGMDFSLHTVILAQAQALWITAFFNGHLPNLKPDAVLQNTILMTEYERIRRPRSGKRFPDLVFDSLPYVDQLLEDLGLPAKRKGTWSDEWFAPYGVKEYRGLVQEWKISLENAR